MAFFYRVGPNIFIGKEARTIDWQESVKTMTISDPTPLAPAVGDRYIVKAPGVGDWLGHDNEITEWDGSVWLFVPLSEGMATWVEDIDEAVIWTGAAWTKLAMTINHDDLLGITPDNHHSEQHAFGGAVHTPDTLANVNGRITDADIKDKAEIDAEFAQIKGFVFELGLTWVDVKSLTIGAGVAKNSDNDGYTEVVAPLTVDLTVAGAGGLDAGAEAANAWYYVWLIKNPTTSAVAGLFSVSSTAPTMPAGYTKKRLLGVVRNDGGSDILKFNQTGGNRRSFYYIEERTTTLRLLNAGVAVAWTDVDCSSLVPPVAELGRYELSHQFQGYVEIRPKGETISMRGGAYYAIAYMEIPPGTDRKLQYYVHGPMGGGNASLGVVGFIMEI